MCVCVYKSMYIHTCVHTYTHYVCVFDIHTYITISKQLYSFKTQELCIYVHKMVCVG